MYNLNNSSLSGFLDRGGVVRPKPQAMWHAPADAQARFLDQVQPPPSGMPFSSPLPQAREQGISQFLRQFPQGIPQGVPSPQVPPAYDGVRQQLQQAGDNLRQQMQASPQIQQLKAAFQQTPSGQAFQQALSGFPQRMQAAPGYDTLAASPLGAIFSRTMGGQ